MAPVTPTPITVSVPATMANLGPGFDSFGLALSLVNRFHVTPAASPSVSLHSATCVAFPELPSGGDSLMHRAMAAVFSHAGLTIIDSHIAIEAHVPVERGLGSSSTAIVAGLLAANAWLNDPLPACTLLQLAHQLEGHPDNVAPALQGGVQLCHVDENTQHVTAHALPWPDHWQWVVVVPKTPLATHAARQAMPESYPLATVVSALQHSALWVQAVHTQNPKTMAAALFDSVHHPYRGPLIPLYGALMAWCKQNAPTIIGGCISGAGSTLGVLVNTQHATTASIAKQLKTWLAEHSLAPNGDGIAHVWPVSISATGGHVTASP